EQVTLHPQPGVLSLQLAQPGSLLGGQPLGFAAVDAVLADPVAQRGVVDPQLPGDHGDRPAGGPDQLDRVALELLGEPSTAPLGRLSVFLSHEGIPSSEVSCLRGEVQSARSARASGSSTTAGISPRGSGCWRSARRPGTAGGPRTGGGRAGRATRYK